MNRFNGDKTVIPLLGGSTSSHVLTLPSTRYPYKDKQAGTNFAPMHPHFRSAHYDDIPSNLYGYRASRRNGKTVQEITHNVTFKEWIQKYKP